MLTRLKVSGFKNLVDVDVRFGPFTCIAGSNGVGKSNLFDAIQFLSALANHTLLEAAAFVRSEGSQTKDVRSLFHRVGDTYAPQMSFEAEMIVPQEALDDLEQKATATTTFLRYSLILAYREDKSQFSSGSLELIKEELTHISRSEATKHLLFHHSVSWRKSVLTGRRQPAFISTEGDSIKRHQDGGSSGRAFRLAARNLPRTVLSVSNASESPTALVARREMESWRLLQLEPAALRQPDEFNAPIHLGSNGMHLPATLYHLTQTNGKVNGLSQSKNALQLYAQVANRLAELIDDVKDIWIDRDETRELLTLYVRNRDGTPHPARALSDGTLRFLALSVLEQDPDTQGLLCLEEPENGIHPARIPAMLSLLQNVAVDPTEPVGIDNPLRQIIINTHSPGVVGQVEDDNLLVAELKEGIHFSGQAYKKTCFGCLSDTWRVKVPEGINVVNRGSLLAYLNPVLPDDPEFESDETRASKNKGRRIIDREDLRISLFSQQADEHFDLHSGK